MSDPDDDWIRSLYSRQSPYDGLSDEAKDVLERILTIHQFTTKRSLPIADWQAKELQSLDQQMVALGYVRDERAPYHRHRFVKKQEGETTHE